MISPMILQKYHHRHAIYCSTNFVPKSSHAMKVSFLLQEIHVTDVGGRLVICAFVLNSMIGSIALWFIVRRTKLCLDFWYLLTPNTAVPNCYLSLKLNLHFSCTFHIFHLFVCWWFNASFPWTFSWWLLNCVCATIMCALGEVLCLKTELKEIPVGYTALNTKADLWVAIRVILLCRYVRNYVIFRSKKKPNEFFLFGII